MKAQKLVARVLAALLLVALIFGMILPAVRAEELEEEKPGILTAGSKHSLLLNADGTVVGAGSNAGGQIAVEQWKNIEKIQAWGVTVGLQKDGKVVVAGSGAGSTQAASWTYMKDIAVGENNIVGVRSYGGVLVAGDNTYGQKKAEYWYSIEQVAVTEKTVFGLKNDGSVVAEGSDAFHIQEAASWKNMASVSAGKTHVAGLTKEATVLACGNNTFGQCDTASWKDMMQVVAGGEHTVGLKADGTVAAVGRNDEGQCDTSEWKDVIQVAAGANFTMALTKDGTILCTGSNGNGQLDLPEILPVELEYQKGNTVTFGSWEGKELRWTVLDRNNGEAILISEDVLWEKDYGECDASGERPTWKSTELRKWLNGEFLDEAFTSTEKKVILTRNISEPKNNGYKVETVSDKVALPGLDEAKRYFATDEERTAESGAWLLRTYSNDPKTIWIVTEKGKVEEKGVYADSYHLGVRPVICIHYRDLIQ